MTQAAQADKTAAETIYDKKETPPPAAKAKEAPAAKAETPTAKPADVKPAAEAKPEGEGATKEEKPADPAADDKGEGEGKDKPAAAKEAPDTKKDSESDKATKEKEAAKPVEKPLELKLPEGSTLDDEHVDAVKDFAKAQGLSAEQAQAILDRDHESLVASHQAIQEAHKKEAAGWVDLIKKDKELGGKNYTATVDRANAFLNKFGDSEFKQELSRTLLGNHPGLVRIGNRVMKFLEDDSFVDAPRNAASKEGAIRVEDQIYDKTKTAS